MFHLGGWIALGMDIRNLLQLQGTFEGHRIILQAPQIQHVVYILVFLGDVLHMAAVVEGPLDFLGDAVKFVDELLAFLVLHRALQFGEAQGQHGHHRHLRGERLGGGNTDFGTGMGVDARVGNP